MAANVWQLRLSARLNNGSLQYQSLPQTFNAGQLLPLGPTPGQIIATKMGTNVNLTELVQPGICTIQNLDTVNYVEVGIWDSNTNEFYPLLEVLAGEIWPVRLSRFIGEDIGTGSGTHAGGTGKYMRLKGIGGACACIVLAFNL